MQPLRILLVQLGANGDCLFVTTIAKQIKEIDYPGCHLTWMIGSIYRQVIEQNPHVDTVLEIPMLKGKEEVLNLINSIPELVNKASVDNYYDKVFITDYTPINHRNWYGTTRSSLFRSYPHPLRINPQPLILLTQHEVDNVHKFCKQNEITEATYNILFECAPQSGQSQMTFELALEIAKDIVNENKRIKIILSTPKRFIPPMPDIIDGSKISWRENAELANYCNLLIGCSSGISWLCTTNWVKPIPIIQVIDPGYMGGLFSASMKTDFLYFGIDTSRIIELHNPSDKIIVECVLLAANDKFKTAKRNNDISDKRYFKNLNFLLESKLPFWEKSYLLMKFQFSTSIFKVYRKLKPSWFKPTIWLRNIIQSKKYD